jgi:hypothetical protein
MFQFSLIKSHGIMLISLHLDAVQTMIGFTGLFVVLFNTSVEPAYAGLALTYVASMGGLFQYTTRLYAEVHSTRLGSNMELSVFLHMQQCPRAIK